MQVIKRNNEVESFDSDKIRIAVGKSIKSIGYHDNNLQDKVVSYVEKNLPEKDVVEVDTVHTLVENAIMDQKAFDVAREYVTYRSRHMPSLYRARDSVKPYEYPELLEYMWAIYDSFWTHREFGYSSDIQDMKVNMSSKEVTALSRTMLAISTVEVKSVKDYWGKLHDRMPKSEIGMVGSSFASNESIHLLAYANLLELMGLNSEFERVNKIPALKRRLDYLATSMKGRDGTDKEFTRTLILFALFTENVSLFSQFLIILTINKERNVLKGIANAVQATSKEEAIHANFGIELVNILRKEHPEFFDSEMESYVNEMLMESYEAEKAIIDWIFEEGEFDYLPKKDIDLFLKDRFNQSMSACGFDKPFDTDESEVDEKFEWFEVEVATTNRVDFFNKKNTNYQRKNVPISADDLI